MTVERETLSNEETTASQGIAIAIEVLSGTLATKSEQLTIERGTLSNEEISASRGTISAHELVSKTLASKFSRLPLK